MKDKNEQFLKVGDMVTYTPTKYESYEMKIENMNGVCMLVERDSKRRVIKTLIFNKTDFKELEKMNS